MRTLVLLTGTALALAACGAQRPTAATSGNGPTQTTLSSFDFGDPGGTRRNAEPYTPSPPDLNDAQHPANRLAAAACERQIECNQVGEGRAFATNQTCLMAAARHAHENLDAANCEAGLDDARLSACIHVVRRSPCSTNFASSNVFAECRASALCGK